MKRAGRLLLTGVLLLLLLSGCTAPDPTAEAPASPAPCGSGVQTGPLPMWARAGFSDAEDPNGARAPHVLSRQGDIVGVLFGGRLNSPPAPDRSNKILWVSRLPVAPGGALEIAAQLDGTAETVKQTVAGGPGPSIVDLPRPGCWRVTLAWSGHTDAMDLTYQPPPAPSATP